MQQEHRVQEDRREGFTDDWAPVAAEVQSQILSRAPTRATPRIQSQTPGNLGIGAVAAPLGNPFDSQETVMSFDFSQMARLAPTHSTPLIQSQTAGNLGIGAVAAPLGNQFDLQETVTSFDFSQMARLAPTHLTPLIQSQTPSNLGIGALAAPPGNQFDSQEMVSSFNFSQTAARLQSFRDSAPQTPDRSQDVAMGLTLDNTVTPTTLRQLALSIDDLESQEEAAVHSEPSDIEQGQGGSNHACS